ncbi:MAG: hypothetical protein WBM07_19300 [Chitinivibrionales bacterium]
MSFMIKTTGKSLPGPKRLGISKIASGYFLYSKLGKCLKKRKWISG